MKNRAITRQSKRYKRDPIKISLTMGHIIIVMGYIGVFVQAFFGGFSFFIVLYNYIIIPNYQFMSYYAKVSSTLNFINIYVSAISCIINSTYTTFCWILVPSLPMNIILSICIVLGIITLALSLTCVEITQIFYAMTSRQPDWYNDPNFDPSGSWRKTAYAPYRLKEIFRSILYLIQAILYIFGHQNTNYKLVKQFDL